MTTTVDTLPNTCRCRARWSGTTTAHCGACHTTYTGETTWTRHRRNGKCLNPTEAGLTLDPRRPYPCWGTPAEDTP
jgi:hypothetical protein